MAPAHQQDERGKMNQQAQRLWDDGDFVLWGAKLNGCVAQARVPKGLTVMVEPVWTEHVRGVRLVDQHGHEWGNSFRQHSTV